MKKSMLMLAILSLALPGCNGVDTASFQDKTFEVHSLLSLMNTEVAQYASDPVKLEEKIRKPSVTLKINSAYPDVLYSDFKTYATLLANDLPSEYTVSIKDSEFLVYGANKQPTFACGVDLKNLELYYAGSLSLDYIGVDPSAIVGALTADMKIDQSVVVTPKEIVNRISFARFAKDLPVYEQRGSLLAPLGLFDSAFGAAVSAYHIFDGKGIFQYSNAMALAIPVGDSKMSTADKLKEYYKDKGMPKDLRLLDKASLYLIMDHFYGLRDARGIRSMSDYFDNLGFGASLLAEDAGTRCYNFCDIFAALDDDHTGVSSLATWFGDDVKYHHRSARSNERRYLKSSLTEARNRALGTKATQYGVDETVHYSTSGKTAYFYFDSFVPDLTVYDESKRDEIWHKDSYFYFLHQFQEIVKHGGVERVIIDDSCNGGGTIGIAVKLLALISKDNYGVSNNLDINTKGITKLGCQVDSNQDGKYDADDVFGDDFNIAILTSPVSFSCGNLFPVHAQRTGDATIIGQNSGGGECVVGTRFLPSGRGIQHSSTSVLCDYSNGTLKRGYEDGAKPDITIPYCDFYNLDALETALTASQAE